MTMEACPVCNSPRNNPAGACATCGWDFPVVIGDGGHVTQGKLINARAAWGSKQKKEVFQGAPPQASTASEEDFNPPSNSETKARYSHVPKTRRAYMPTAADPELMRQYRKKYDRRGGLEKMLDLVHPLTRPLELCLINLAERIAKRIGVHPGTVIAVPIGLVLLGFVWIFLKLMIIKK